MHRQYVQDFELGSMLWSHPDTSTWLCQNVCVLFLFFFGMSMSMLHSPVNKGSMLRSHPDTSTPAQDFGEKINRCNLVFDQMLKLNHFILGSWPNNSPLNLECQDPQSQRNIARPVHRKKIPGTPRASKNIVEYPKCIERWCWIHPSASKNVVRCWDSSASKNDVGHLL